MKQAFKMLGLALLGMASLLSCSREVLPETEKPEEIVVEQPKTHTILIKAGNSGDTRTQIGADNKSSLWTAGDRIMVYQEYQRTGDSEWVTDLRESEEGTTTDGGKTMSFPVTFDAVNPGDGQYFTYRAVYPGGNVEFEPDWWQLSTFPPRTQYPTATSFDPDADILVSRPLPSEDEQPSELNLEFRRFTALGQMTLVGAPADLPEGAMVRSVTFSTGIPLIRRLIMDSWNDNNDYWEEDGSFYSTDIVMDYEGKNLSPIGLKAQFMCAPCVLEECSFTVSVVVSAGDQLYSYSRVIELSGDRSIAFETGYASTFSVNMSEAELVELGPFSIEFDEYTLERFPELEDNRLEIPFVVGGGGDNPKKTKADPGDYIWLYFEANHPWSVSFSESWLSASPISGGMGEGYFNLYATANDTGASREATMTITSDWGGMIEITVVQEPFSQPKSISLNAPQTVPAYTPFNMEVVLDTDDPDHYRYTYIDNEYDSNIKWLDDGVMILAPGTYSFYAVFSYSSINFYMESEPVTVTVTEPDAPTDWYYLIKRENKPYLIHRNGGSDTAIQLSEQELAQVSDLAITSDGTTVYVVGADPDENNVLVPCLWTIEGSSATKTNFDLSGGSPKKIVLDGGDIYVLADYLPKTVVLKNNEVLWTSQAYDEINDIAVDNGHVYLCGADQFENWAVGNKPYLWTDGVSKPLAKYVDNDLYQQRYYPQRVKVKDGSVFVTGYLMARDRYSHDHAVAAMWEGDDYSYVYRSRSDWWWTCLYDMSFLEGDHRIYVGESFYNSSTNRQLQPVFYIDYIPDYLSAYNKLPLNYSGEAGLNQVQLCNGIPVLRGTIDGETAFWEAPWKNPVVWDNDEDEVIGFVVK